MPPNASFTGTTATVNFVPLGKRDNVATFSFVHGYSQFAAFCCEIDDADRCEQPIALPSGIISDDDDDDAHDEILVSIPLPWQHLWQRPPEIDNNKPSQTAFNLQGPPTTNSEGESDTADVVSTPNVILDKETRQPKEIGGVVDAAPSIWPCANEKAQNNG
jgi:hypothetical protein